jgi:hypothetical protein
MSFPNSIPMAQVLQAANDLVAKAVILDYAVGGAMAAIFYVEPFATFDIDLFYKPASTSMDADIPAIFSALQNRGWEVEGAHLLCAGFPVQFLVATGLTAEALDNALLTRFEGKPTKVFRAEYILAIAAQVGRAKDKSRIAQMLDQLEIDRDLLRKILDRHKLKIDGL